MNMREMRATQMPQVHAPAEAIEHAMVSAPATSISVKNI